MKWTKTKLLFLLLLLTVLAGCGADNDELSPALTVDPLPAVNITRSRVVSGTVEPGAVVTVAVNTTATVGAVSNAAGLWSVTIDNLAIGANTLTITATDSTGNSTAISLVLTYEIVTLERYVTPTPLANQTIGGLLAAGAAPPVVVLSTTATAGVVTVSGVNSEFWSCDLSGLVAGANTVTVTHTDIDALEQTVTAVLTFDGTTPLVTIESPLSDTTADPRQAFAGTRDLDVSVQVSVNGGTPVAADTPGPTTWSFTPNSDLHEGKNSLSITGALANSPTTVLRTFVVYAP